MYQLPPNTLVIWGDRKQKTFRLTGGNSYQYASIEEILYENGGSNHYLGGSTSGDHTLNEFIDTINILKPFLKHLYRS